MSYQVHNFQTGEIIEAAPVNEMDAQIQKNERDINTNISAALAMLSDTRPVIADQTYNEGDVFICNGQLVRMTSTISAGTAVDTGTEGNAEPTTIVDILNSFTNAEGVSF